MFTGCIDIISQKLWGTVAIVCKFVIESLMSVVMVFALGSGLVEVVRVEIDRVKIVNAVLFVSVVIGTADDIVVFVANFVVDCFTVFDFFDNGDELMFTFVELFIAVV